MPEEKPLEQRAQESPYKTTLKDLIPFWSFVQMRKDFNSKNYTPAEKRNAFIACAALEAVKCSCYTMGVLGLYELNK